MTYDKINNIEIYTSNSADIYLGLKWLRNVNPDIANGVYEINPRVKAIVSEYTTKENNENGYEAHRKYIDIQYLIGGEEVVNSLPLEYLNEVRAYDKESDVAFYKETGIKPQELLLGNGYFAILFPHDGHMPQLCVNEPMKVKKVVIKIKFGE